MEIILRKGRTILIMPVKDVKDLNKILNLMNSLESQLKSKGRQ